MAPPGGSNSSVLRTVLDLVYKGKAQAEKYKNDIKKIGETQVLSSKKQQMAIKKTTAQLEQQLIAQQKVAKQSRMLGEAARSMGRDLFYVSVQIAAAATAMKFIIQKNLEFGKQLSFVGTMLDKNTKHFLADYREGILDLSSAMGKTTDDLSKGLFQILSATIPPAEAMTLLGTASKFAVAGFIDVNLAVNPLITAMNVYNYTAEESIDIADKMFASYEKGIFTIQDLSQNFGDIAATAKTAGVTMEELLAFLALLTKNGLQLNKAVTATQGLMKAFINPTVDAAKAVRALTRHNKDLTLELNSNFVRTKGLVGVLEELGKMTDQQRNKLVGRIEGIKALSIAIGKEADLEKTWQHIMDSGGTMMEKNTEVMKDRAQKLAELRESFSRLSVEFGTPLGDGSSVKALIDSINKLSPVTKRAVGGVVQLGIALGVGSSAAFILFHTLGPLKGALTAAATRATATANGMSLMGVRMGVATKSAKLLSFTLNNIGGILGVVSLAVTAFLVGVETRLYFMRREIEALQDAADEDTRFVNTALKRKKAYLELKGVLEKLLGTEEKAMRQLNTMYGEGHSGRDIQLKRIRKDMEAYQNALDIRGAKIGKALTEQERKRIRIESGLESNTEKQKRLNEELREELRLIVHASSDNSREEHITNYIALNKELIAVKKALAKEEEKAKKAWIKSRDHNLKLAIDAINTDKKGIEKSKRLTAKAAEDVKFAWSGYYDWKKEQIEAEHVETLRWTDDEALANTLLTERLKALAVDQKEHFIAQNREWVDVWIDGVEDVRTAFADAFDGVFDIVNDGAKDSSQILEDFVRGIGDAISRAIAEILAMQAMMALFGKGFAKGDWGGLIGGFVGSMVGGGTSTKTSGSTGSGTSTGGLNGVYGNIGFAAEGMVVDKPSIMVAGEKGPEAIIPLKRGRLKTEDTGGGGGITVNATIQALDASSFSQFAERNKTVFDSQIMASVARSPKVRRQLKKHL